MARPRKEVPKSMEEQALQAQAEREERSAEAHENFVQVQDQKSGVPVTDDPEAAEAARQSRDDPNSEFNREHYKQLNEENEERAREQQRRDNLSDADRAKADKRAIKAVKDEADDVNWFPVRLKQGYVPLKFYRVVEGDAQRIHRAPGAEGVAGTLDKVQRGSEIELPIDEAKKAIAAGIAERNDAMRA